MNNIKWVNDSERLAHALRRAQRWTENLQTNLSVYERTGREADAATCRARLMDLADLISILDGSEDEYIASLRTHGVPCSSCGEPMDSPGCCVTGDGDSSHTVAGPGPETSARE